MKKFLITLLVPVFMITACADKKNQASDKPVMVCFGNSLTIGHGAVTPGEDNAENSYPAFLQKRINISVVNAGVSGDTAEQGLSRVSNDVLSKNPKVVIIELGANDLFGKVHPSTTQDNLQKIINLLNNGNRKIYIAKFYTEKIARELLSDIENVDEQTAVIKLYDNMFETLVSSNNADLELIEDIWTGVWGIHMSDTIHPNAKGYEIMAENYFNALLPYFKKNGLLK